MWQNDGKSNFTNSRQERSLQVGFWFSSFNAPPTQHKNIKEVEYLQLDTHCILQLCRPTNRWDKFSLVVSYYFQIFQSCNAASGLLSILLVVMIRCFVHKKRNCPKIERKMEIIPFKGSSQNVKIIKFCSCLDIRFFTGF